MFRLVGWLAAWMTKTLCSSRKTFHDHTRVKLTCFVPLHISATLTFFCKMSVKEVAVVFLVVVFVLEWWSKKRRSLLVPQSGHDNRHAQHNNHDHLKFKHRTQRDAQAEVDRMRREGREGSERLNAYYNDERKGWFIGKGWVKH
jgi:hypothetical protein